MRRVRNPLPRRGAVANGIGPTPRSSSSSLDFRIIVLGTVSRRRFGVDITRGGESGERESHAVPRGLGPTSLRLGDSGDHHAFHPHPHPHPHTRSHLESSLYIPSSSLIYNYIPPTTMSHPASPDGSYIRYTPPARSSSLHRKLDRPSRLESLNLSPVPRRRPTPLLVSSQSTLKETTTPTMGGRTGGREYHTTPPTSAPPAMTEGGSVGRKVTKPFLLADIGEGITECEIVKWLVEPNTPIQSFDPLVEVQSDKATVEITSPYSGIVTKLHGAVGDTIKVGKVLCDLEVEEDVEEVEVQVQVTASGEDVAGGPVTGSAGSSITSSPDGFISKQAGLASPEGPKSQVHSTPAVRRLAKENDIDISILHPGTGKDGRVTKEDVINHLKSGVSAVTEVDRPGSAFSYSSGPSTPTLSRISSEYGLGLGSGPDREPVKVPLGSTRKAMFRAMSQSLQIPHFAYSDEVDVTELERLRVTLNREGIPDTFRLSRSGDKTAVVAGGEGIGDEGRFDKITLLPLLIKAMSHAMRENPIFCSSLVTPPPPPPPSSPSSPTTTPQSEEPYLLQRRSHDISIALSTPAGLYTPLITSVQDLSPFEIASRIKTLQSLGNGGGKPRFSPSDLKPGTLTLSNVGTVGGTYTHPVIPPTGQLAIGAMGKVRVLPRYPDELTPTLKQMILDPGSGSTSVGDMTLPTPIPRLIMSVSFTADHRVVEGVELARLVESWKGWVERPWRMIGLGR